MQPVEESGSETLPTDTPVLGPAMKDTVLWCHYREAGLGSLTWFLSDTSLRELQEGLMCAEGSSRRLVSR